MQPRGTQPAQACPNCGAGAEHQEESGCLTLSILFYLIFLSIATFLIATHPPIDWLSLSIYIIIFIISLFFVSSWGRPLLHKFPLLSNTPFIIIICFGLYLLLKLYSFNSPQALFGLLAALLFIIALSPWFKYVLRWSLFFLLSLILLGGILTVSSIVTHPPVDYLKLFATLLVFLSLLTFPPLFLRFLSGRFMRRDETKDIHFSLGRQTIFPPERAESTVKTILDFHFMGVSVQILSTGKFWKFTLSTDSS